MVGNFRHRLVRSICYSKFFPHFCTLLKPGGHKDHGGCCRPKAVSWRFFRGTVTGAWEFSQDPPVTSAAFGPKKDDGPTKSQSPTHAQQLEHCHVWPVWVMPFHEPAVLNKLLAHVGTSWKIPFFSLRGHGLQWTIASTKQSTSWWNNGNRSHSKKTPLWAAHVQAKAREDFQPI